MASELEGLIAGLLVRVSCAGEDGESSYFASTTWDRWTSRVPVAGQYVNPEEHVMAVWCL